MFAQNWEVVISLFVSRIVVVVVVVDTVVVVVVAAAAVDANRTTNLNRTVSWRCLRWSRLWQSSLEPSLRENKYYKTCITRKLVVSFISNNNVWISWKSIGTKLELSLVDELEIEDIRWWFSEWEGIFSFSIFQLIQIRHISWKSFITLYSKSFPTAPILSLHERRVANRVMQADRSTFSTPPLSAVFLSRMFIHLIICYQLWSNNTMDRKRGRDEVEWMNKISFYSTSFIHISEAATLWSQVTQHCKHLHPASQSTNRR